MENVLKPTIEGKYIGDYRNELVHLQSGNLLITDAPLDNNGKGESFSPTDLVAAAIVSCMLTVAAIRADKSNFKIGNCNYSCQKIMDSDPRQIKALIINFNFEDKYSKKEKLIIENAIRTCPVALSLNIDIIQDVTINYSNS